MFSLKFRNLVCLLSFLVIVPLKLQGAFSDEQCIKGDFETKITHKGPPVGLMNVVLDIHKKGCVITIEHHKLKFVSKRWVIDICRSPVHIKYGSGSVDVLKRKGRCNPGELNDYCPAFETLSYVLQDDGLIFADGEREDLLQPHGQVFCSYLLVRSYLGKGMVFSKDGQYDSVLERNEPIDGSMFVKTTEPQSAETIEVPADAKSPTTW